MLDRCERLTWICKQFPFLDKKGEGYTAWVTEIFGKKFPVFKMK